MPGRKPLPTSLKVLRGNPGKRPLNHREPKPGSKAKLPKAPSFLNDRAKKEWRNMGKRLFDMGLLTELDETALAMYCWSLSRWIQANGEIEEYGAVLVQGSKLKQSPWVAIANEAWRQTIRMMAEFGMTPSSRSRVSIELPTGHLDSDGIDWFGVRKN